LDRLTAVSRLIRWLPLVVVLFAFTAVLLSRYMPIEELEPSQQVLDLEERSGTLTILYDNNPYEEGCLTEWGFSCLVELEDNTILFDTGGDPEVLAHNMGALGVDVMEIDCIVLSHEHGDHVGGINVVLDANPDVSVYLPETFPYHIKSNIRVKGAEVVETSNATVICEGVATTRVLDARPDEQALIINTGEGLMLVTGCSHPGVENLARDALNLTGGEIRLAIGGYHLGGASRAQLDALVEEMKELGVEKVAPTHCSGALARQVFSEGYGEDYVEAGVGFCMDF
jgi:7,8-dihydropterin-6-yl-methyl-4-(beta-D-ribofuranosyl)aminobenzene 5'-phosphate synthase